ncbi:hypothetical protein [Polyangium aurulentum]|uniref:hypothetical protein n=1 Tax=Polyangium aurulentum TaxID=2567896 RepID=UPI00200F2420|nr:hypothetical protein [Polyangium aurulentum]UQA60436.1 hypothetical protein E8A73_008175 [Polyangium aurulentum]
MRRHSRHPQRPHPLTPRRIPDERHPRHSLEPRVPMRELEQLADPLRPLRRPIGHDARPRPERLAQAPIEIAPDEEHEHERPRIPFAASNKPKRHDHLLCYRVVTIAHAKHRERPP